jgi:hypothetical protein
LRPAHAIGQTILNGQTRLFCELPSRSNCWERPPPHQFHPRVFFSGFPSDSGPSIFFSLL